MTERCFAKGKACTRCDGLFIYSFQYSTHQVWQTIKSYRHAFEKNVAVFGIREYFATLHAPGASHDALLHSRLMKTPRGLTWSYLKFSSSLVDDKHNRSIESFQQTYFLGEGIAMGMWRARSSGFYPMTPEDATKAMKGCRYLEYDLQKIVLSCRFDCSHRSHIILFSGSHINNTLSLRVVFPNENEELVIIF